MNHEEFSRAVKIILSPSVRHVDPWLLDYYAALRRRGAAEQYLRYRRELYRFGRVNPAGKRTLEAGCGFGLALVAARVLGASRAAGLDLYRPMVETVESYLPLLPAELSSGIDVAVGDVAAMPYAGGTFDVVVSNEAVSHYADIDGFIAEARRVLRPGGVLIVHDGNNLRNPLTRRTRERIWDAFERGVGKERLDERRGTTPYRERRRELLSEALPGEDAAVLAALAERTYGLARDAVLEAADRYRETRELPPPPRSSQPPVDPDTGIVMERAFDPFELARRMRSHGFSTRVAGYWGGASGRPTIRLVNAFLTTLSPVTIATAKAYRIAAVAE